LLSDFRFNLLSGLGFSIFSIFRQIFEQDFLTPDVTGRNCVLFASYNNNEVSDWVLVRFIIDRLEVGRKKGNSVV